MFENGEDTAEPPENKFSVERMIEEEPSVFTDYSNPLL